MGTARLLGIAVAITFAVSAAGYAVAARSAVPDRRPAVPGHAYQVGHRVLGFSRGPDRPLPTDVWYPVVDRGVAPGRFPVVLFSHGLHGLPEHFRALASAWAAAGMVVVAPAYPHTKARTGSFRRADMRNQPADAQYVLRRLRRLHGDPLAGHLDTEEIAAVGFSAGAFTTTGLLTAEREPGLRAAVLVSGRAAPGAFRGAPVPLLFVHGDADPVVPYQAGRAVYERTHWPKTFLTVPDGRHGEFLRPGGRDHAAVAAHLTGFLRAHLFAPDATAARVVVGPRPAPTAAVPPPRCRPPCDHAV
jgi:dienelactone hydrolase